MFDKLPRLLFSLPFIVLGSILLWAGHGWIGTIICARRNLLGLRYGSLGGCWISLILKKMPWP